MLPLQNHSSDSKIRISSPALYRTYFSHLYSEVINEAPSCDKALRTGITEWMAETPGALLSLAWDWQTLDDGGLGERFDYSPRSNLMIVCDRGYDVGMHETDKVLFEFVRRLPWREEVSRTIQARGLGTPSGPRGCVQPKIFDCCIGLIN